MHVGRVASSSPGSAPGMKLFLLTIANSEICLQTNPAAEQSKITGWSESPESSWSQSDKEGKGLWRKGFAEEPSLELE